MADVREWVDGSKTVRVYGLDTKWPSLGTAQFDLETLIGSGLSAANDALVSWRGRYAETFVEDANEVFRKLSQLAVQVVKAKRTLMLWPVRPGRPPLDEENAAMARVEATEEPGTAAADPDKLDAFRVWCEGACLGLPSLTGAVNLDGITAEVTRPVPVLSGRFGDVGLLPPFGQSGLLGDTEPQPAGEAPAETETETFAADPALYVDLPDLTGRTAAVVDLAGRLAAWAGVVAIGFREGDGRLIAFLTAHPDLADEILAGFQDHQLGGESSLVILLAYFDRFDKGSDGSVSREDLAAMAANSDVPPYVAAAANYLLYNERLFDLVETMNDGKDHALDMLGGNGDGRISAGDITDFLAFNDQLAVLEQNFGAFDTAAHPDQEADGQVSYHDLEALAGGDGELAEAAAWLMDHDDALTRLMWYERAKDGFLGKKFGEQPITVASLVLLTVDQQVYSDHPDQSASFVDRRFETLMNANVGAAADPDGMTATFTSALTASTDRASLMARVITEVATDGAIHNPGLPLAFAHGAAANMPLLDHYINGPGQYLIGDVPDGVSESYLNTARFVGLVSLDPAAAERLGQAVYDYGLVEVVGAPDSGQDRTIRLMQVGTIQGFVEAAQDHALTEAAWDEIRAYAERSEIGASAGSISDYGISHVPFLGTVNDIADGMGLSAGDGMDWLLGHLGEDPDVFDSMSAAEQADRTNRAQTSINRSVWLAVDLYDSDPAVRASAQGLPFVAADGSLKSSMAGEELLAFRIWATELVGTTAAPGPAWDDNNTIQGGERDVDAPGHGIQIEDAP